MASRTKIEPDQTIPSVTKPITEASILEFESTGILDRENIHNNPELAAKRLGTTYTLASGRMSITFAAESMRKFFGPEVFNHTGTVNLKFLRPVKAGDTITVTGAVSGTEEGDLGTKVSVDLFCDNQDGNRTAVGIGTAVVK
ncbi:MAG: MaoC family dehydratase [Chloroflexota bacterium]|uniref:MaoC-like domain-containing protein n=1 Tax=marine metagenome TaxID=408172 RepID=A0A381RV33_9ZZZZ|nr:MaoC family dehydratase [Chloroflexota bacterium]